MTPAKLWLQIFLSGFAVIVGLLAFTLLSPIPYGDLSRIGLLSDRAFGWRIEPPHVAPEYLRAAPITEADILVIGDSFSMTHRWQSVLTQAGYRVTTTFWGQFNESLCDDFDDWLDRAGFKGKLVVIESVERILRSRLEASEQCRKMTKPFAAKAEPFSPPLDHLPGFKLNWSAKLTSGWVTYDNTRRAKNSATDTESGFQTWTRTVPNGCAMFSHNLCNKALFFGEDDNNGELTPEQVTQMQAFTRKHPHPKLLWMVIPNKTTVYVQPQHSQDFVTALQSSGLGPDLFSFAAEKKTKIRDFYFPNDTHLSMHGQLALGERMLTEVRKIIPMPPSRTP